MKKVDYSLKSELMSDGLYFLYKDLRKSLFWNKPTFYGSTLSQTKNPYTKYSYEDAQVILQGLTETQKEIVEECERIYHANVSRTTRLKKRISKMLNNGTCCFLTLTFNDASLERTNSDTRRQAVRRYLNSFNAPYVANIDFGSENGREHYHAVIRLEKSNFDRSKWLDTYGFIDVKEIKGSKSEVKLAKYISKLTSHAIKETCRQNRCIYSREH